MLAPGVEEPHERPQRALHRLACYAIEGMERGAAQKLLAELIDAATAPAFSYVHTWRKGDVVMWDNRATLHRGRPWPAHEARLMVRTTISATEADGLASVRPPSRQAAE